MSKNRLFAIALLIVMSAAILLPSYNIFNLQPAVYRMLIAATEQDTTRIAQHLSDYVFPELDGVPQSEPDFGDLVREMFEVKRVFGLVKLKIYSSKGLVLFSTDTAEINRLNQQDFFAEKVSRGRNYAKVLTYPGKDSATDIHVVQTCIPVMRAGVFSGAVEIDYNITDRKVAIDNLIHRSSLFLFVVGTFVFMASAYFWFRSRFAAVKQQEAEEELRSAHRQLENIIEFLPDATFVVDQQGRVVAWNRAIEEMTDVCKEDIIGKGDYEYALAFYGQRRPMLIDGVKNEPGFLSQYFDTVYKRGETLFAESVLALIHNKRRVNLWATASPLFDKDGQYVGAIESIRDISERRIAQQNLSDKKVLLENILNNIPHYVFWKDRNSVFLGCNLNFARVAGVDGPEGIIGKTDFDLAWEKEEAEFYRQCDREVMESGEPLLNIEEPQLQADGKQAVLLTSKVPLRNSHGEVVGILGIYTDITDQKKLEQQLRQSQKIEAVGTLAGGIAHDFNNILTAVIGYTEFTINDLPKESQGRSALGEVLKAAHRAKDLTRQILMFGQKMDHERSPMVVGPVIREALQLLRATLPATITISEEIDNDLGMVMADPTQIHQVVLNLGTNAHHAMQENGGVLKVKVDGLFVDEELAESNPSLRKGAYIRLTVSDTGHGMGADVMEHIFEPYFTTKRIGEGSGLGLAVVHGIIRGHGGAVSVSSSESEGTTFTVYLPMLESVGDKRFEYNVALPEGNERILFVDDEETLASLGKKTLESLGYTVTSTTSSKAALELFRENPYAFDLVFTDQTMPALTGLNLSKELLKIRPEMPIVLCTGFSEKTSAEVVRNAGIREYVMKPLSKRDFALTLRKALDGFG